MKGVVSKRVFKGEGSQNNYLFNDKIDWINLDNEGFTDKLS